MYVVCTCVQITGPGNYAIMILIMYRDKVVWLRLKGLFCRIQRILLVILFTFGEINIGTISVACSCIKLMWISECKVEKFLNFFT